MTAENISTNPFENSEENSNLSGCLCTEYLCESAGDKSKQYIIRSSTGNYVRFAILEEELCAHTWNCIGEGRQFLAELETHAANKGLNLTIPTGINPKLQTILTDNGYHTTTVEWFPRPDSFEAIDLWVK
ncbi:hypothetical protein LI82_12685 [Methanococcoides methylutens]|uniref:Uncharacterized protein n=1 Tax=Methanococcoides methylutens TaxID=2226 RepID=A0A099T0C6_METMT|nr:hypothetical protein [Methanococcoides methylutens]KGK97631.1 hypothetical protein LI82_12685 [Methanococcoides methylutens]